MTSKKKVLLGVALVLIVAGAVTAILKLHPKRLLPGPPPALTLEGSVLEANDDPAKETPLAAVSVTAETGVNSVTTKTDPAGMFSLTLDPGPKKGQTVKLTFQAQNHKTLQLIPSNPGDQLYIARLEPLQQTRAMLKKEGSPGKVVEITNIQVRYTFKDQSMMSVGSLAKQFQAPNKGNVPCRGKPPCSPDGRWKATSSVFNFESAPGDEFRNVRVSCVAGPCAFTKIQPEKFPLAERNINLSVLNWSDTTDFLVEADVMRTVITQKVQHSYPFIVGQTMNFALPPSSEGPCIEADLDGQYIVFPMGPALNISLSVCSLEVSPDGNKLYRCQLKPGYHFH